MKDGISLRAALDDAALRLAPSQTARRDAELLLMHAISCDRAFLLTHPEMKLALEQAATYDSWLSRRAQNEPVQYIVGEQEFFGLKFRVTPDVLIPRLETEHLVEAALARVNHNAPLRIADIGTGSGAIAVALAHALPNARVAATDISQAALDVARGNAELHGAGARIEFIESDLLGAVKEESFDLIVSNPPYVADSEQPEAQVRDFEPRLALFAGPDGLDVYRRLIPPAREALKPGGWLLMEIGHGQREALWELLRGWDEASFIGDLQGIPRVACARRV